MSIHGFSQTLPVADRKTWRRHLPAWVGLVQHNARGTRWPAGFYARIGDHIAGFSVH